MDLPGFRLHAFRGDYHFAMDRFGDTALAAVPLWDAVAACIFFGVWIIYNILLDGRFRHPRSINSLMIAVREGWMRRMLAREQRMMDAALIGHSIRTATFFASTTLILLAGLIGLLSSAERLHAATADMSLLLASGGLALFEIKVLLLLGIFVHAFFKFTWAIRQFNYFSAVVGSAPEPGAPLDPHLARRMADMLSHAFWQFNAGVRAYYFALAALGWFIHPAAMVLGAALVTLVLRYRQLYSRTAHDIARHVESLSAGHDRESLDAKQERI